MKKLFITIAFVAAAFFAQAQLFVGGNIGFDYTKNPMTGDFAGAEKLTQISIMPNVGYMFAENMGVGASLGWSYLKATNSLGDLKVSLFAFNPYFRYVFAEIGDFSFYADAQLSLAFGSRKNASDQSVFAWGIGVTPGLAYNLTDNFAMVAYLNVLRLGVSQYKVGDDKMTNFGIGINQDTDLSVGFVYNF